MLSSSKIIISNEMKKYLQSLMDKYIEKCKDKKNENIVYVKKNK